MMTAEDFMICDLIYVRPNALIRDVLLQFAERKVSGMPVLDQDRHLAGMITIGDILTHLQPHFSHTIDLLSFVTYYVEDTSLPELIQDGIMQPVHTMMTKRHLVTVAPTTPIEDISSIFSRQRFKKLPVVNDQAQVVGVISRGDLIRYIVKEILQQQ